MQSFIVVLPLAHDIAIMTSLFDTSLDHDMQRHTLALLIFLAHLF